MMFSTITLIATLPALSLSALPLADRPAPQLWFQGSIAQAEATQTEPAIENNLSRFLAAGKAHSEAGDDAAAAESYKQALLLIQSLERVDPLLEVEALGGLGTAYAYLQEDDQAIPLLEEALALYDSLIADETDPDKAQLAYAEVRLTLLRFLGAIHHDRANYATALGYNKPALMLAEALEKNREQAILQHNIGSIQADIGEYMLAEKALMAAARLSEVEGPPGLKASALFTLGWVSERQENYEGAIAHYQTALSRYEVAFNNPDIADDQTELAQLTSRKLRTLNNLGMVHFKQQNLAAAQKNV